VLVVYPRLKDAIYTKVSHERLLSYVRIGVSMLSDIPNDFRCIDVGVEKGMLWDG